MALSFDDRILGEKVDYYCSSSEDEDKDFVITKDGEADSKPPPSHISNGGYSANTGPKGVIEDWRRFKQLETEQREEQAMERLELAKKLSLTCRTTQEDDIDKEMEELLNENQDEFLKAYRRQRLMDMHQLVETNAQFGKVFELTRSSFLDAIDNEQSNVTIVIHLYKQNVSGCVSMSRCFACLCKEYLNIKFCQICISEAPLSLNFSLNALPTLLVYKSKELVGNFVRITDELGDEFYATDLESFLIEHGFLNDESAYKRSIRSSTNQREDAVTSDLELDD